MRRSGRSASTSPACLATSRTWRTSTGCSPGRPMGCRGQQVASLGRDGRNLDGIEKTWWNNAENLENSTRQKRRKSLQCHSFGLSIYSTDDVQGGEVELRRRGGTAETVSGYVMRVKAIRAKTSGSLRQTVRQRPILVRSSSH